LLLVEPHAATSTPGLLEGQDKEILVATLKYLALNILSPLKFLFIRNVKFKKCLWCAIHQSEQLGLIYQLPFPLR
jgi:hypothetical protein